MTILKEILKLKNHLSLIQRMVQKEMTDRYAGSAFGLLWTIIQPLFLISLYTLVFTFIFKVRIGGDGSPVFYAFYAIAGLLPWMAVADGLSKSVFAVSSKASLVKQAVFPTEILPLVSITTGFIPLVIGFLIYFAGVILLNPSQINWLILTLPLVMMIHYIFIAGIAYFLSIVGAYFKDLSEIITLFLTVGLFITPILYLEESVPTVFQWPMRLNLIAHLINMYRDIIFYGRINHPWSFIIFTITAVLFFLLGFAAFKKVRHLFANVL